MEATAELQAPLVSVLSGSLFADWGSDLGSGASVIGNPAGACARMRVRACVCVHVCARALCNVRAQHMLAAWACCLAKIVSLPVHPFRLTLVTLW